MKSNAGVGITSILSRGAGTGAARRAVEGVTQGCQNGAHLCTAVTSYPLLSSGFMWSDCRDLNSGPSVPQTVPAKSNPFPARQEPRNDGLPTTGGACRNTPGGPKSKRNVTRGVTRARRAGPCCDQRPTNGGNPQ